MEIRPGDIVLVMVHDREVWARVDWTDGFHYLDVEPLTGVLAETSIVCKTDDVITIG